MKQEWIARAKRFATYALVGCFDTGMDWVAFTTAHELLHFTPLICQAIGYIVGTTGSFNGALIYVGIHALVAVLSYLVLVGDIKRIELKPVAGR